LPARIPIPFRTRRVHLDGIRGVVLSPEDLEDLEAEAELAIFYDEKLPSIRIGQRLLDSLLDLYTGVASLTLHLFAHHRTVKHLLGLKMALG
jgi:hypothetical protein